jgi:hypothetical protein
VTAWKLFPGKVAHVSTPEFHEHRERAAHLEQEGHRPRLIKAAEFVEQAQAVDQSRLSVSDLGCGDGGLLELLKARQWPAWGYDFAPANEAGWQERGVDASRLDVFGADRDKVRFGDIAVVTEVLEHLSDPFEAVRWIGLHSSWIVASSPHDETGKWHDECHAWAFDVQGYRALISGGGFQLVRHEIVGRFQLILGRRP